MSEDGKALEPEMVRPEEIIGTLCHTRPFAQVDPAILQKALEGPGQVERVRTHAGEVLVSPGDEWLYYWIVLEGEARAERVEEDGAPILLGVVRPGEGFGETAFLTGKTHSTIRLTASLDSLLLRFSDQQFWQLMTCCPSARKAALADVAQRLKIYQVEALHREKLVSLGTMAAGLMHELHNPGSAAKRAASLLRGNLERLQELSLRAAGKPKTPSQLECMQSLLHHALKTCKAPALSTLDQADAEEAMSEWLQAAGVENAYTIGPALVAIGFDQKELDCARVEFETAGFSDALNWLDALVSSVSQLSTIEESISRISELVMAVKKFAYDDRSTNRELNVHDNLQSTITILGHKLRQRQVRIEKRFAADPAVILTRGSALSQVWTNLIDNAADASPEGGQVEIATWNEPAQNGAPGWLAVSVTDHGTGIPEEVRPHIFEPFFTTKPQGSGTGLGLEIAQRIVTQKFSGSIEVESEPGRTSFIVRLPMASV